MLARLEALAGIDNTEIDYRGDLLRLSAADERALGLATDVLRQLGYETTGASDADVQEVTAWYGLDSVADLSRIEAGVIADRIVPPFAQTRNLPADQTKRLHAAIVDGLHNCFVTQSVSSGRSLGEFRLACVRIVQESVDPILGTDSARTLAELLNDDMSQDHRHS
ncbi:MAG: hypothetical protein E6J23_06630 [Chloroflexi bacterium]|nr:MAG: hypothetical protein E6J23_06630 [Chloroflexota bacterium]